MNKSKLDPNQISQYEHDEETCSKKVKMVNTELAMELNADDGDSVQTQARVFEYSPASGEAIDITACKEIKIYGTGAMEAFVSPDTSGENWISVSAFSDTSAILSVLARRMKVNGSVSKILGRG